LLNALIEQVIYYHRQAGQPGKNEDVLIKSLASISDISVLMPLFQAVQENQIFVDRNKGGYFSLFCKTGFPLNMAWKDETFDAHIDIF